MKKPHRLRVVLEVEGSRPVVAVALTLVACVCGCAGKNRPLGEEVLAGTVPSWGTNRNAYVAFAACMRKHGLTQITRLRGGGVRVTGEDARVRAATSACAFTLPPRDSNITPAEAARFRAEILTFTRCVRQHGVDLPDPTLTRLPGGFDVSYHRKRGQAPPQAHPLWKRATAACRQLNPLSR